MDFSFVLVLFGVLQIIYAKYDISNEQKVILGSIALGLGLTPLCVQSCLFNREIHQRGTSHFVDWIHKFLCSLTGSYKDNGRIQLILSKPLPLVYKEDFLFFFSKFHQSFSEDITEIKGVYLLKLLYLIPKWIFGVFVILYSLAVYCVYAPLMLMIYLPIRMTSPCDPFSGCYQWKQKGKVLIESFERFNNNMTPLESLKSDMGHVDGIDMIENHLIDLGFVRRIRNSNVKVELRHEGSGYLVSIYLSHKEYGLVNIVPNYQKGNCGLDEIKYLCYVIDFIAENDSFYCDYDPNTTVNRSHCYSLKKLFYDCLNSGNPGAGVKQVRVQIMNKESSFCDPAYYYMLNKKSKMYLELLCEKYCGRFNSEILFHVINSKSPYRSRIEGVGNYSWKLLISDVSRLLYEELKVSFRNYKSMDESKISKRIKLELTTDYYSEREFFFKKDIFSEKNPETENALEERMEELEKEEIFFKNKKETQVLSERFLKEISEVSKETVVKASFSLVESPIAPVEIITVKQPRSVRQKMKKDEKKMKKEEMRRMEALGIKELPKEVPMDVVVNLKTEVVSLGDISSIIQRSDEYLKRCFIKAPRNRYYPLALSSRKDPEFDPFKFAMNEGYDFLRSSCRIWNGNGPVHNLSDYGNLTFQGVKPFLSQEVISIPFYIEKIYRFFKESSLFVEKGGSRMRRKEGTDFLLGGLKSLGLKVFGRTFGDFFEALKNSPDGLDSTPRILNQEKLVKSFIDYNNWERAYSRFSKYLDAVGARSLNRKKWMPDVEEIKGSEDEILQTLMDKFSETWKEKEKNNKEHANNKMELNNPNSSNQTDRNNKIQKIKIKSQRDKATSSRLSIIMLFNLLFLVNAFLKDKSRKENDYFQFDYSGYLKLFSILGLKKKTSGSLMCMMFDILSLDFMRGSIFRGNMLSSRKRRSKGRRLTVSPKTELRENMRGNIVSCQEEIESKRIKVEKDLAKKQKGKKKKRGDKQETQEFVFDSTRYLVAPGKLKKIFDIYI